VYGNIKGKVNSTLEQVTESQTGSIGITVSVTSVLDEGGWSIISLGSFIQRERPAPIV
jgi:hypothetical protein